MKTEFQAVLILSAIFTALLQISVGKEESLHQSLSDPPLSGWYSPMWPYRIPVACTAFPGSDTLRDYQIKIALTSANMNFSQAQSRGQDLRVTGSDGSTELHFWLQEFDPVAQLAVIWVRVPVILPADDQVLYVYYGNPVAQSASRGDSTFIQFDDFELAADVAPRADLSNFEEYLEDTSQIILPNAPPPAWDQRIREIGNTIFDPDDPVYEHRYKTFYTGYKPPYNGGTDSTFIGLAYSPDGRRWQRYDSVTHWGSEDPYVVKTDSLYHMYYEIKTHTRQDYCCIGLATSPDCTTWTIIDTVLRPVGGGNPSGWQAADVSSPVVLLEDGVFYLYYEGRGAVINGQIGLATSTDGRHFTRYGLDPVIPSYLGFGWDSAAVVPDDVQKVGDTYYMIYHGWRPGRAFNCGLATSTDLFHWTKISIIPFSERSVVMAFNDSLGTAFTTVWDSDINYSIAYPRRWVPGAWPFYNWIPERRGVHVISPGDSVPAIAQIYTENGKLHLRGHQNLNSCGGIRSVASYTNGFAVVMKRKTASYINAFYEGVSIGSGPITDLNGNPGNAADWTRPVLQSGYSFQLFTVNYSAIWRMPAFGVYVPLTAEWSVQDSFASKEQVQTIAYASNGRLRYMIGDSAWLTALDTTYLHSPKRILISQGERLLSGHGGDQTLDWVFVRKYREPEPLVLPRSWEAPVHIITPNGGELHLLGNSFPVNWTYVGRDTLVLIELNRNYPEAPWEMLRNLVANDGYEQVTVHGSPSGRCRIRVTTLPEYNFAESDSNFYLLSSESYLTFVRPDLPGISLPVAAAEATAPFPSATIELCLQNLGMTTCSVDSAFLALGASFSVVSNCPRIETLETASLAPCTLRVAFHPSAPGSYFDTLSVFTNAGNALGGRVRLPLSGECFSSLAAPQVVITLENTSVRLIWRAVVDTTGGTGVPADGYAIYQTCGANGPCTFLGATPDTFFVHTDILALPENRRFYQVVAYRGSIPAPTLGR